MLEWGSTPSCSAATDKELASRTSNRVSTQNLNSSRRSAISHDDVWPFSYSGVLTNTNRINGPGRRSQHHLPPLLLACHECMTRANPSGTMEPTSGYREVEIKSGLWLRVWKLTSAQERRPRPKEQRHGHLRELKTQGTPSASRTLPP